MILDNNNFILTERIYISLYIYWTMKWINLNKVNESSLLHVQSVFHEGDPSVVGCGFTFYCQIEYIYIYVSN